MQAVALALCLCHLLTVWLRQVTCPSSPCPQASSSPLKAQSSRVAPSEHAGCGSRCCQGSHCLGAGTHAHAHIHTRVRICPEHVLAQQPPSAPA